MSVNVGPVNAGPTRIVSAQTVGTLVEAARYALSRAVTKDERYKRQPRVRCARCYGWLQKDGQTWPHRPHCQVPEWERALLATLVRP